jgi:hypothetical protein
MMDSWICITVNVLWYSMFMVCIRVMFGAVVTHVCIPRGPSHFELSVFYPVLDPIETYVHLPWPFLVHSGIDDAVSCRIICGEFSGLLGMPHIC